MRLSGAARMPSMPDTANDSTGRGLPSTQAKPSGATPCERHASAASSAVAGRQSITSTMPSATPIKPSGASVPQGRAAAQNTSGPRWAVRRDRSSTVLRPLTMRPANG